MEKHTLVSEEVTEDNIKDRKIVNCGTNLEEEESSGDWENEVDM